MNAKQTLFAIWLRLLLENADHLNLCSKGKSLPKLNVLTLILAIALDLKNLL